MNPRIGLQERIVIMESGRIEVVSELNFFSNSLTSSILSAAP